MRKPITRFEKWLVKTVGKDSIRDLAEFGAQGGFSGLIYCQDTYAAYDKWEVEIWQTLCEMADNMGVGNPLALIAQFTGADNICDSDTFKNLLVWAVCEETARNLVQD